MYGAKYRSNVMCLGLFERANVIWTSEEENMNSAEEMFQWMKGHAFPKLAKDIKLQIQEATESPYWVNTKKATLWHIIVKLKKTKDMKTSKQTNFEKRTQKNNKLASNFSREIIEDRRQWYNRFSVFILNKKLST